MWSSVTNAIAGSFGSKKVYPEPSSSTADCSDDEVSSCTSSEEGLECPICWESFNIVENVPYVLWCGHTLCKNCVLGLQWAVVKFSNLPVQLPLFISCPWCHLLSFRLIYNGDLRFPRKNFFLLWMVESMNGDRGKSRPSSLADHQLAWPTDRGSVLGSHSHHHSLRRSASSRSENSHSHASRTNIIIDSLQFQRIHSSLQKSLAFFVHFTTKFPLIIIFLLIVLYAIPASALILALYIFITILFALPSLLVLYFAFPSLDWLIREIVT